MLAKLTSSLSLLTIITLNIILLLVTTSPMEALIHQWRFIVLVNLMYVALIASSILNARLNWQCKQRGWATLFAANVAIVFIPTTLHMAGGFQLPFVFLIGLDLYWLNLYLIYVVSHRHTFTTK